MKIPVPHWFIPTPTEHACGHNQSLFCVYAGNRSGGITRCSKAIHGGAMGDRAMRNMHFSRKMQCPLEKEANGQGVVLALIRSHAPCQNSSSLKPLFPLHISNAKTWKFHTEDPADTSRRCLPRRRKTIDLNLISWATEYPFRNILEY